MSIASRFINILTLGYAGKVAKIEGELKSLRDLAFTGDSYQTGMGAVGIVRTGFGPTSRLFKKQNVNTLRRYAEFSTWVRAAIDIYRDTITRADWKLQPVDSTKPINEKIEAEIGKLLTEPNPARQSYSLLKEMMAEDFLVLGHGAIEIGLRNNATPYGLFSLDAARLAFVTGWDGTDKTKPRYALLDRGYMAPARYLADPMAMVLVNRPRSYDLLGLSHVETLDLAVRALLETDDYFLRESQDPTKSGALDLGTGVSQEQVDEVRAQIDAVRRAFIVMGGSEGAQYIPFTASERELRMLDRQTWFVRQVATVFQVPIAKLQVKAEGMNRASTESQFEEMQEGPGAFLDRMRDAENASIIALFGKPEHHNLRLDYPVMSRRDEKRQAEITSIQTGRSSWMTTNEARQDAGKDPIKLKVADEILIPTRGGPIPLSVLEQQYFTPGAGDDNPPDDDPADDDDDDAEDEESKARQSSIAVA